MKGQVSAISRGNCPVDTLLPGPPYHAGVALQIDIQQGVLILAGRGSPNAFAVGGPVDRRDARPAWNRQRPLGAAIERYQADSRLRTAFFPFADRKHCPVR